MSYKIEQTPCYPCSWKIVALGYRCNNSWTEYFKTYEEAVDEIVRRKGILI